MGPGRARDASKSSRIFAAPRKTSQPPPGRPQGGPQASPGMPQGSPRDLFAWIFDSILMSICIGDNTRPGGMRGAFESAAPAGVLNAFEVMHCINTLHTILQSPNGGLFNPPYLPLAPRIPPGARELVSFSPFFVFFCMSKF